MDYYHIMLLPWGPRCLWSASFAPGRPRLHRHLRGLASSPSKDRSPGAGFTIFTPRKERLRMGYTVGLYVPRLAVVSWNPLALVGRTWQFCGKPPRNQASTVWLRQLSRSIFQDRCVERFVGMWPSYEMNNSWIVIDESFIIP